uniref:HU domain-containing protein n=1 Tax=Prevotella sp. GTC17259 TaxID=3236795 RepID=A0AB33JBY7_9BACT
MLPTSEHDNPPWSTKQNMANRPIAYTLTERKATIGAMAGKTVIQANPTGRKRIDHRSFCDEVAHATTFTGAEVEAVLRLAAEIAKRHVENGDIVEFGDIGTLTPSFHSKLVEKGKTEFNPNIHITKPVVRLSPSRKYFTLSGVSYERVEAPAKKTKPSGSSTEEEDLP